MTTPTTTRDGAFLALALAEALKLGLPDPDYITVHVSLASSTRISAVDFQFNDRRGQDPLPRLYAWADRFGVEVRVSAGSDDAPSTWHKFGFTHAGVLFDAYAEIVTAECAECGRFVCDCADDMGEDATDSIASDEAAVPEVCGLPVFGDDERPCPLFATHEKLPGCPGAGEPPVHSGEGITGLHWDHLGSWGDAS